MPLAEHSVAPTNEGAGILLRTLRPALDQESLKPVEGDSVVVHYECRFEEDESSYHNDTGVVVDSTYERNKRPLQFVVGANQVICGIEIAVLYMKQGQKVEVTVPPLYAFGRQRGRRSLPADIPPHRTLIFQLELMEVISKVRK